MMLIPPARLDPDNAAHLDFLHRKILYAVDERPVLWWKTGTKYGVIEGNITPLWNMWVFFVQRVVEHRDDSFDVASLEAVYLTDVDTGALLDTWHNVYTGETLPVPGQLMGPETQTFGGDGAPVRSALPGINIERTHSLGPATLAGDDVWLAIDSSAVVTRTQEPDARPFRVNDLETFNAKLSDVLDPDLESAPATAALHLISSWQTWLNMGARPGSQVTRLVARKTFDPADLPDGLTKLMRRLHPDILHDPAAALERPPESFER